MTLQTPDALDEEYQAIHALAAERGLTFQEAARAHWFGYRPGDGRAINPMVLDMSRTSLEIAAEINARIRDIAKTERERQLLLDAGLGDAEIERLARRAA